MNITPEDLLSSMRAGTAPAIVDVRSAPEFVAGHIPGAIHLPFWSALFRAGRIRTSRESAVVVYCGHGPRAGMAAEALRLRGFQDVRLLRGHMARWRAAGLPLERG